MQKWCTVNFWVAYGPGSHEFSAYKLAYLWRQDLMSINVLASVNNYV